MPPTGRTCRSWNSLSSIRGVFLALLLLAGIAEAHRPVVSVARSKPVTPIRDLISPAQTVETDGDWQIWREDESGIVRRMVPRHPSDKISFKGLDPSAATRSFLETEAVRLGIAPIINELEIAETRSGIATRHLLYRRMINGVPVGDGCVSVHTTLGGNLLFARIGLDPRLQPSKRSALIDSDQAIRLAVGSHYKAGQAPIPESELIYVELEDGLELVWRVRYLADEPRGDWEVWIDAADGTERMRRDRAWYLDGEGTVWSPNPVNALEWATPVNELDDADQALFDPAYETVTLRDLDPPEGDGLYRLSGPHVHISDHENPITGIPAVGSPDGFHATRESDLFEAVMVYFHIDTNQRYLQSLGFTGDAEVVPFSIAVDPHGLNGQDNSWYTPSNKSLAFGDGCVDDAEDGDVIVHEYGHAIQDSQVPGWLSAGQMGSMGEGFGDYWAESFTDRTGRTFGLGQVFDWDGPGSGCWAGRRVDTEKIYPDSLVGQLHADGEIWSGSLWDIRKVLGGEVTDRIVIESHFFVVTPADFKDGALAVIAADEALNGGVNGSLLFGAFRARGILDDDDIIAPLLAAPSTPDELIEGEEFEASIDVAAGSVLRSGLIYGGDRAPADTLFLQPSGLTWSGMSSSITIGVDTLFYYYWAEDGLGRSATFPTDAPSTLFLAAIEPDELPPTIDHSPITDLLDSELPLILTATIVDNLGIDPALVACEYSFDGVASPEVEESFTLSLLPGSDSVYTGTFPDQPGGVGIYAYLVRAADLAINSNSATNPVSGRYEFQVWADTVAPSIIHEPPASVSRGEVPVEIFAMIDDDGALNPDSLLVQYNFRGTPRDTAGSAPFMLIPNRGTETVFYRAELPLSDKAVGQVEYSILAVDHAIAANRTISPSDGLHSFEILPRLPGVTVISRNPFADAISFRLLLGKNGNVQFRVFDLAGRLVVDLLDGHYPKGLLDVTWDGRNTEGRDVAQGIYFYHLDAGGREEMGRIVRLQYAE